MKEFDRLFEIVRTLRSENGCPWDKEQTLHTMRDSLIEETYEVVDSIDRNHTEDLREELGDLMFLGLFLAYLGEQDTRFTVAEVLETVSEKLVRRHPHVFCGDSVDGIPDILKNWEAIKQTETKNRGKGVFDGIPNSLPEIQRFFKILHKIDRNGENLRDYEEKPLDGAMENAMNDLNSDTAAVLFKTLLIECYSRKIDVAHLIRSAGEEVKSRYLKKKSE
ncbi:MAG: hypothetical protein A2Y33_04465 [Spirochaetes bacterium GWF1_51_8]|nr:MAG: hypothetical protein A2Y33_04465 [Spirochaetes bacterium GWF1_51_8]